MPRKKKTKTGSIKLAPPNANYCIDLGPGRNPVPLPTKTIKKHTPAAWRVESMPDIRAVPKKANYYRAYRGDTLLKHTSWQYMFGGILRAIFGVYSPAKYWNRDLEEKLRQELGAEDKEYGEKMQYGIFSYTVTKNTVIRGLVWKHNQKPKKLIFSVANQPRFFLMKGRIIYVRVNCLEDKDHVDIEFYPFNKWGYQGPTIVTAPLSTLQRLLQGGYVKQIAQHKLWKLKKNEL